MTTRPAPVNYHLYLGATFQESATLKDSDDQPLDLTGYSALMHVRREREDLSPLYVFTTDDGSIELGGAAGTVKLRLNAQDTSNEDLIDPDGEVWVYDLLLTNGNEDPPVVDRTMAGFVFAHPGVTR